MNAAATRLCQIPLNAIISAGWKLWPDHDEFSFQLVQLVRALEDGGGAVAECLVILGRIAPGNGEDWYREWKNQADACKVRADIALAHKDLLTAQSNWLQASAYYRSAGVFLAADDKRKSSLFSAMETCSHLYLGSMKPAGEIVNIPYDRNRSIRGYFLRAPNAARRSPAVICFGGPGETKDELLEKMPRFAFDRGLSLMVVDLPGEGAPGSANVFLERNVELPIGYCVDYLSARGDVDDGRIALFGNNFGATYASRAASLDHRFAAAVCDGGIWEENRVSHLWNWALGGGDGNSVEVPRYRIARQLQCPFLVTSGDYEFLNVQDAAKLYEHCKERGAPMEFKLFSVEDAGSPRRRFIFDWIAAKTASDVSTKGEDSNKSSFDRRQI